MGWKGLVGSLSDPETRLIVVVTVYVPPSRIGEVNEFDFQELVGDEFFSGAFAPSGKFFTNA